MLTSVTGVEEEDAAHDLTETFVCVTEHDNVGFFLLNAKPHFFVQITGVDDVMDEELASVQFHQLSFLERCDVFVDIAGNGSDRRDLLELSCDGEGSDITTMDDVFDVLEQSGNPGVEIPVCVRNDADLHGKAKR